MKSEGEGGERGRGVRGEREGMRVRMGVRDEDGSEG